MKNPLILIVGMPGSGKSFAAQALKKHLSTKVVETGDIVREEIKSRGWKYTPETSKKIRHYFHSGRENLIIKRAWDKIKKSNRKVRVIVGFRCLKEVEILRKHFKGKIVIIAIKAPFKIRAERERKRKRFGKSESLEYLKKRDKDEIRIGEKSLIDHADYSISNSNITKTQTEASIVKLVKKIIKQA